VSLTEYFACVQVFPGDYLISVDNEDVAEKALAYIASKVAGPVGTIVTLGLKVGCSDIIGRVAVARGDVEVGKWTVESKKRGR
jgi:C-terminal processing protease CtpA/Prc